MVSPSPVRAATHRRP